MTIRIITLSGASGAGKSSYCRELIHGGLYELVPSQTTRPSRSKDLPGEYVYLNGEQFGQLHRAGKLLWTMEAHGHSYGTRRDSLTRVIERRSPVIGVMPVLPDCIPVLRSFLEGENAKVIHFWCLSPEESVLRERFGRRIARGDMSDEEAERRIFDCREADDEAVRSDIPYLHIPSRIDIRQAAVNIRRLTAEICRLGG